MELKPCPFCGGKASLRTTVVSSLYMKAFVICDKCRSSSGIFGDDQHDGTFIFKAIEAWNARVNDD